MLFDARVAPAGLLDADLETLRHFGVGAVLAVAQTPVIPTAKAWRAAWEALFEVELERLEKAGFRAFASVGVPPQGLPRRGLGEVLTRLPECFADRRAVAVGPVGFDAFGPAEDELFDAQRRIARAAKLPLWVVTVERRREAVTRQVLLRLRTPDAGETVVIDGADTKTVRLIRECGHWACVTLEPGGTTAEQAVALIRKLGPERLILNSACGHREQDMLALARAEHLLEKARVPAAVIARVSALNLAAALKVSL